MLVVELCIGLLFISCKLLFALDLNVNFVCVELRCCASSSGLYTIVCLFVSFDFSCDTMFYYCYSREFAIFVCGCLVLVLFRVDDFGCGFYRFGLTF